jgi:hypothetical protein
VGNPKKKTIASAENLDAVLHAAFNGARAGEAVRKGILWGAALGKAGTGRPIKMLHGAAADYATLARVGLGPVASGGFGMAGGKIVLAVAATSAVVLVGGATVAYKVLGRPDGDTEVDATV